MSTSPQPPRPPVPPEPPRSGSNVVAIVLLVLALIVLVSGMAVWTGLRFLSHSVRVQVEDGKRGSKAVSIDGPGGSLGSFKVKNDVNEDSLGLPIYPGARRVNDQDSATVDLGFGGEAGVRVLAAKFETTDPLEKVKTFYSARLGSEVTKFTEHGSSGQASFEIKTSRQEKVVALEPAEDKTLIQLVRVSFGKTESN